jgi:hypothetical protein
MSNYEARINGDGFQNLSQVFKEAIFITKRLGFCYLWIDSLCIIQDSDNGEDWTIESKKMAQYYGQSTLNIAAVPSNGPSKGFLQGRNKWPFKSLVQLLYINRSGEKQGHLYAYQMGSTPGQRYWNAVRQSLLIERGWIFQEWILARRLLWFTPQGVFFECQADSVSPRTEFNETVSFAAAESEAKAQFKLKHNLRHPGVDRYLSWYDIVESYTGSKLSNPGKGRIFAIAGVAKVFRDMILLADATGFGRSSRPMNYLSGIWLQDLHHGLLWEQLHPQTANTKVCKAPTWSWAPWSMQVRWAERCPKVTNMIECHGFVERDETSPTASDPLLSISAQQDQSASRDTDLTTTFNRLSVRGRIQRVLVRNFFKRSDIATAAEATDHAPDFGRENWRMICSLDKPSTIVGWGSFENPDVYTGEGPDRTVEVDCLLISTREASNKPGYAFGYIKEYHPIHNVLYLQPCGPRRYQRVGVGRIFGKDVVTAFQSTINQMIELV